MRLGVGDYPAVGLKAARDAVVAARAAVAKGGDPAGERRDKRTLARTDHVRTLTDLAGAYFAACEAGDWKPRKKVKRARTLRDEKALFDLHLASRLGSFRLEEITKVRIRGALQDISKSGAPVRANRAHALLRQMFAYALAELPRITANPVLSVSPVADEKPRERVLSDKEIRLFWNALEHPAGLKVRKGGVDADLTIGEPVRIGLMLATLLLQRRTEVAQMARGELDLENGSWTIASDRSKNDRVQVVPLSEWAVTLIHRAIAIADEDKTPSDFVFPSPRDRSKPISGGALSHAGRDLYLALGIADATVHDLRRTGASMMASERIGIAPYVVSRVLGHTSDAGGGAAVTAKHYNRYAYTAEKRDALDRWQSLLRHMFDKNIDTIRPGSLSTTT